MRKILGLIIYVIVQILFTPFRIIGAAGSIIIADFYVNQFVNGDVISGKKKV